MNLNFSDEVMYTLPFYLGPLFVLSILSYLKKHKNYRFNDTLTNASIALGNLGFSFIILLGVVTAYSYAYKEFRLFELDQSSPLTYILAFVAYDFCYYWNHRIHHMIGLFWTDHLVHHTAENFNFGVSIRISYFTELTMWMSFIVMAFLGISLEVFLVASYIQVFWAFCIHTESLKKTPWLDKFFNTPSLHRVHHARNGKYIDKNFGGILVVWDQLFGTYQRELEEEPVVYGVRESYPSFSPLVINSYYLKTIWKKIQLSRSPWEIFCSVFASPGWLPKGVEKRNFYSDVVRIPCSQFKPRDPYISLRTKLTTVVRFFVTLILFCYLMSYFGDFPVLPVTALSLLFLWLSHYNGIVLDGRDVGWGAEIISQGLAGIFLYWAVSTEQSNLLIISTVSLMVIALLNYIVYRQGRELKGRLLPQSETL
ncbi:sterol desaturase family protein [Vibrio spartinae]|uniref:Fatty acid hydroxylase domain-containing protein n=1 Tax=Vibrio spartinae TaxID=1918945 RepID=A0ABX6R0X5_9VIBR|nr:sterol desaturase family protein [Vibrio spartinae]QMV14832.1 Fatty acid hydroxylase domain-containing protein [Vibrio spartinae]